MNRCVVYSDIKEIAKIFNLLNSFQQKQEIQIVGFSGSEGYYKNIFGFKYYEINELNEVDFEYIILAFKDEKEYKFWREILSEKFPQKKVINYEVFKLPFINIEKYFNLLDKVPTIFSNNCIGGVLTYSLKLSVKSPFINIAINDNDYLKFLENPQKYLNAEIKPFGFGIDKFSNEKKRYPKCLCGDIVLDCVHYKNHKEAIEKWSERSARVNFDNLFIVFTSKNKKNIKKFIELPYKNKICLCPFEYGNNNKNIIQIDLGNNIDYAHWFFYVLGMFSNNFPLINIVDFLHDGRVVKLGDINDSFFG